MSIETDPNTKETNKIGMDMIYQADITDYMNRIRQFKKISAKHIHSSTSYEMKSSKT